MTRPSVVALGLLLLAGACGDDDTVITDDPGRPSVIDEWMLVAGPVPDEALGGSTTLRIEPDGTAGGSTACNSYFTGGPAIDDDRWVATEFGVTEMGCEPDRMDAQSAYLSTLAAMSSVAVGETTLELAGAAGGGTLEFVRVIPPPDSALVDTTWVLESLIRGDAVSSTVGGGADAPLVLSGDGSVAGSDGCTEISGSYEVDGDVIRWDVEIDLGTACDAQVAAQSEHLESVLSEETTFAIDGPRLTITAGDGTGLDYRDRG